MKKNTIIVFSTAIIVLTAIMLLSKPTPKNIDQQTTITPETGRVNLLTVSEKLFDFGTISMKDGKVNHSFKITNPTDKDIFLKKVFTSCMCTNAYIINSNGEKGPFGMEGMSYVPPANETIKTGGSIEINAVFDPNAHGPAGIGPIDRFIVLTDENDNNLELEIKGVVTP